MAGNNAAAVLMFPFAVAIAGQGGQSSPVGRGGCLCRVGEFHDTAGLARYSYRRLTGNVQSSDRRVHMDEGARQEQA